MLRSKYRKRRNKKGGRSFMEAFAQGSGDLKNYANQAGDKLNRAALKTRHNLTVFENARQGAITKTGMDAGFKNPFKKKKTLLKGSYLNKAKLSIPLSPAVRRAANRRQMAYSNEAKRLQGVITGTYKGGKRKKRKTHKKRKMKKRKTRKQRKRKKRKTHRKRRR